MYGEFLRRYLWPQRGTVAWMAAFLLGAIALRLIAPRVVRSFIDQAMAGAPEPALLRLALLFLALSLGAQAIKVLAGYWSDRVAWTASNRLRSDLAAHLLRLDGSFHQKRTPGELIERVDGDVGLLAAFFSSFVVEILGSGLLLAGVLCSLFALHPALGGAFTLFAALTLWGLTRLRSVAALAVAAGREWSARFYGFLGEVIPAAEEIRSAGGEPYIFERFAGMRRGWLPVQIRAEVLAGLVWMLAIAAFGLGDGIAFAIGGSLFNAGALDLGAVYLVVAYAAMLAQPLELMRTQMQHLQRADAALGRIGELFAAQPRIVGGSQELPDGPLAVEVDGVTFAYEGEPVFADLSFRLAPGQRLGLMGRTGSGKSTLARLLSRQYDPTEGAVRLGGVDLREARLDSLRARVGLVTQEVQLFAASLRANITLFDESVPDQRIRAVLHDLGLGEWLKGLPDGLESPIAPDGLSAGEAQLLAFARLFLREPGLVILDEPSSRLDPATEALVERAVQRLLEGRTAIIIAHRPAMLERVDRLMILEDGGVARHVRPEEVLAR